MKWYLKVLKNYAVFEGRARRSEYWYYTLFYLIFVFVIAFVCALMRSQIPYFVFVIFSVIPSIAVGVRRMHDVNKSGWFMLIPFYNLILYCTDGTTGPNSYGPDPKRPEFEEFLNESDAGQP